MLRHHERRASAHRAAARGAAAVFAVAFVAGAALAGPAVDGLAVADRGQSAHAVRGRAPGGVDRSAGVGPDTLTLPGRIGAPPDVLQMVTVTSDGWGSTVGTLKAWQRPPGGGWAVMHGPLPVVLGYAGWVRAAQRRQSTGTSPAGRFALPAAFGLGADPGTALPYTRVDGNDWWPYEPRDPATYNIYQFHKDAATSWRPDYSERLAGYPGQYDEAIVVGFNLPSGVHYSPQRHQRVARDPAHIHRGGGIYLHVRGAGSTAGCIAMVEPHVRWLLRWLAPADHAQIVMGPYAYVLTL